MTIHEDLNQVSMTGEVYGEPITNTTKDGLVCSFRFKVSKRIKANGQTVQKLCYFKVVLFDKVAERWDPEIFAGTRLAISGELDEEVWDQNGRTMKSTRVIGRFVSMIARPGVAHE